MLDSNPFNLLPFLNFYRIWNAFKVEISFQFSRLFKRNIVWGKPYMMNLEPTNFCNLACPECPTGMNILTRPKGNLSLDNFKVIIDKTHRELIYLVLYFQGEPFMNKQLLEMVRYAAKKKIFVQISTNAHFFPTDEKCKEILESGLAALIISLDGMSEASYLAYRINGKFNLVLENIKRLTRIKKDMGLRFPKIFLQCLVSKSNESEINSMQKFAKDTSADKLLLKSMQVYHFDRIEEILPANKKYRRYKQNTDGQWELNGKIENRCKKLWVDSMITWDGQVLPCCFDKDADHVFTHFFDDDNFDFRNNGKLIEFRNSVSQNRKNIDMCRNCTEGIKIYR